MNEKQTQSDWKFGLLWFLTCALGTAGGGLLAFTVMWSIADAMDQVIGEAAAGMVAGLLFGGLLALGANVGPGLLLGSKSISAGRWIGYSVLAGAPGIGATLAMAFSFMDTLSEAAGIIMMGLALGLPVDLAQLAVLRRSGQSAGEWPVVSTVAYLLMGAVILTSTDIRRRFEYGYLLRPDGLTAGSSNRIGYGLAAPAEDGYGLIGYGGGSPGSGTGRPSPF